MKIFILAHGVLVIIAVVLFVGLNYRQLYSAWTIQRETKRLIRQATNAPDEYQNPAPAEDHFDGKLSDFWKFTIINGGGKVLNGTAWRSASISFRDGLTIYHFPDAAFENESSNMFDKPAAGQYNNVSLIGGSGYQPTPQADIVLEFSIRTGDQFYGTAGVVFQLVDTLTKDGVFTKPFDMFGISVVGDESSVMGHNGPLCYLALDWNPVQVVPLHIDSHTWHQYQIRLRWISKTAWLGMVSVDGAKLCSLPMPALGPVEVQVWSDNYLIEYQPQQYWWQIADSMDLKFQNGGNKQFYMGSINIHAEVRSK